MKEKIYCFDFDGTITTKDTLIEFIRHVKGTQALLFGLLLYSPLLVLMKFHLYPNWRAKQLVFRHFFGKMSITDFTAHCQDFAQSHQQLLRPKMMQKIRLAAAAHERIFIVSASIDEWVRPFFTLQGIMGITVLGTKIEVKEGCLTGKFSSNNCYGEEKIHRICEALTQVIDNGKGASSLSFDRTHYDIEAYGDSRGDKEMLAFADNGHYVKANVQAGSSSSKREKLGELIRFGIIGVIATIIQYSIYLLAIHGLPQITPTLGDHSLVTVSNTIAYIGSFIFNFFGSTRYTFKVKANMKRGAGFTFSHIINYSLQTVCLNIFVGIGLTKQLAMLPTLCICIPINFVLVRFFLKR